MGKLLLGNEELNEWDFGGIDRFKYKMFWIYMDHIWYKYSSEPPKILIRKFIEKELSDDVYVGTNQVEKRTNKSAWDTSGYGVVKYYIFNFEEESDAVAFKLKFGDSVQNEEMIDKLMATETDYEKDKRETRERGEYWNDHRH